MTKRADRTPLLSTDQVSKWLGFAPRTICLWAECGTIPAVKLGRQWRFKEADVQAWLAERPGLSAILSRQGGLHLDKGATAEPPQADSSDSAHAMPDRGERMQAQLRKAVDD